MFRLVRLQRVYRVLASEPGLGEIKTLSLKWETKSGTQLNENVRESNPVLINVKLYG